MQSEMYRFPPILIVVCIVTVTSFSVQAESAPVQVIVEVTRYLPDSRTVHHETRQGQAGNIVTIQITTIRPKDTACAAVVTEYQEQVFIGTFPADDYKVVVNGMEQEFRVD